MHLKNIKIDEFLCSHFNIEVLILKMEENTHFWCIMLYYFKKGKNATEKQKRFVQYMEKAL